MKLKTNTMLLAIAAFVIAGGWIYWDVSASNRKQDTAKQPQTAELFRFTEDDVVKLTVSPAAETHLTFERTTESFPNTWRMVAPKDVIADEAAIAFLLDQMASGRTQNVITVDKADWDDFGIAPNGPQTTVELKNGQTHRLLLGSETFDQRNQYALVDPPNPLPNAIQISIVSTTLLDAVQRPLDEWEYDPEALKADPVFEPQTPSDRPSSPERITPPN